MNHPSDHMETTKIDFRTKIVSSFLVPLLSIGVFFSCDVLEPDADVFKPAVSVSENQLFVLSNNSAFIDLNSRLKSNQPVLIRVTATPKHGLLADLGGGLLQYTPSVGRKRASDSFEFTISSQNNQVLKVDTVWIAIENDSTNLPCGIFHTDDYAYGIRKESPVILDVLANDYICGTDSADLVISIYRPDNTFPPYAGDAKVSEGKVIYTPAGNFSEGDKLIYKVHPRDNPEKGSFGVVYLVPEGPCLFSLAEDTFVMDADSLASGVSLQILNNDTLCSAGIEQIHIAVPPQYGNATINNQVVFYQLHDVQTVAPFESDFFVYEVCIDAVCRTARADIFSRVVIDSCTFQAMADTVDLSGNTIPSMYLDVLHNDSICDGYSEFTITDFPDYGSASFDAERQAILYQRDPLLNKDDELEYELCSGDLCSRAKVYIKR